jgi:hypothetical protein
MRRVAVLAAVLATGAVAATAGARDGTGSVRGRVIDTTCPGPCNSGDQHRPFTGDAVVRIRSLPDRKLVAEVEVAKSRFQAELAPGRYRLRAVPYPDQPRPNCWESKSRRADLSEAETTRVRLSVHNACVV